MTKKNIYYDNGESLEQLLTMNDLQAHDNSSVSHKELLSKYTLKNPIGLFNAAHKFNDNHKFNDETTIGFAKEGMFACTYTSDKVIKNQPSQFGQLYNYPSNIKSTQDTRVTQIWFDSYNGDIFTRTGSINNPIGDIPFSRLTFNTDVYNKAGNEFPMTGLVPGMLFYRSDENVLYILQELPNTWVPVIDTKIDKSTAIKLTHPWWQLDDCDSDKNIHVLKINDDLNNLTDPGCYSCKDSTCAKSLKNTPYTLGNFRLVVQANIEGWGMQLLFAGPQNEIYTRGFSQNPVNEDETIFTNWEKLAFATDKVSKAISADTDKNGLSIDEGYLKKSGGVMTGPLETYDILKNKTPLMDYDVVVASSRVRGGIEFTDRKDRVGSAIYTVQDKNNSKYMQFVQENVLNGEQCEFTFGFIGNEKRAQLTTQRFDVGGELNVQKKINVPYVNGTVRDALAVSNIAKPREAVDLISSEMATNDRFRIRIGGDHDQGWVELATADNADEPIYIRQYSCNGTTNPWNSISRTATILDQYGNTTFPGTVTAQRVVNAIYNDYAEFFERGEDTEPGDIIALDMSDNSKEKYVKAIKDSDVVVGVQSDEFAYVIGGMTPDDTRDIVSFNMDNYIPVALMGRVHVKVAGEVHKGDKIIPSSMAGIGVSCGKDEDSSHYVGIALETNTDSAIKKVRILVRR